MAAPVTPEQLAEARSALGRQLAALRDAAGLTQAQLAKLTGYTRSAIANVETGRSTQPRTCWVRYDQLLGAGGALLVGYDHYFALTEQRRQQVTLERERQRTAKIDQWRRPVLTTPPGAHDQYDSEVERGLMGLAYVDAAMPGPTHEVPVAETARRHPADGKLMVFVDEGVFRYGRDDQMVWLPSFWIDANLVTNAEYVAFVNATGHNPPSHWPDGAVPDGLGDHPVVNVTHADATAYAAWTGKQLPSEQQWEKAARGPSGCAYPWGNQPTPAKCNVRESGVGTTTPVGLYRSGVSPYGVYDLAGNVWEWCRTETRPGRFVLKGSAFTSPFAAAAAAETNDAGAGMLDDDTGFRCVLPVEPDAGPTQ